MNRWLKIGLYVLAVLLLQEVVVRWAFPLPELRNFDRINYQAVKPAALSRSLRDQPWAWKASPDTNATFVHEMNAYGFRDVEWNTEREAGKKRVMMVGDSFVEGIMAGQNEKITDGFAAAAGPNVEVMNFGMLGVGVENYLQLITDAVPIFKPDVVFLVLFSNDFTDRPIPIPALRLEAEYHSPWKPRALELLALSDAGNSVPMRFGKEPKLFLPAVDTTDADWPRKETVIRTHCAPDIAAAMIDGSFNYYKANQLLREEQQLKIPVSLINQLTFARNICNQYGSKLVVCYVPARHQVTNHYLQYDLAMCTQKCTPAMDLRDPQYHVHRDLLARDCQTLSLPLVDFTQLVYEQEYEGNRLYWNYEDHMRAKGYLLLGTELHDIWAGNE